MKSTQLRKDLTYFGQFGTRGLGYDVEQLAKMISDLLGTNSLQPVILVGVGSLGTALLAYRGFEQEGFEIIAAFDIDPKRQRNKRITQPILPMDKLAEFVRETIEQAMKLVEDLRDGVPVLQSDVPEDVVVNNVNLAIELENLSYFIQN